MNNPLSLYNGVTLRNGVKMPRIGFGSSRTDGSYVKTAIKLGYRLIDTAAQYGCEAGVGKSIQESGVPRAELFVTSKVLADNYGYDSTLRGFDESMQKLGLDYLDLYLTHWPHSPKFFPNSWKQYNRGTWAAMERLYREGRVRAIGVSNYWPHYMDALLETAQIIPMVNQFEMHPGWYLKDVIAKNKELGIQSECHGSVGGDVAGVLLDPTLNELAKKYGKSPAQMCLRWEIQHGVIPLFKAPTEEYMIENSLVWDWEISEEDMEIINNIAPCGGHNSDPDTHLDRTIQKWKVEVLHP